MILTDSLVKEMFAEAAMRGQSKRVGVGPANLQVVLIWGAKGDKDHSYRLVLGRKHRKVEEREVGVYRKAFFSAGWVVSEEGAWGERWLMRAEREPEEEEDKQVEFFKKMEGELVEKAAEVGIELNEEGVEKFAKKLKGELG